MPHLFTPFVADAAGELDLDDDHLHGPTYLDLDEGVEAFARTLADLIPSDGDGRHRRRDRRHAPAPRARCFADWPPRAASEVMGAARLVQDTRRAGLSPPFAVDHRAGHGRRSRPQLVPGARQTDLTATFLHRVFELGAEANVLDPIWQVMPDHQADLPWTIHGDIACPLLSTERALVQGDVLWVDSGITYGGYHSDFGRTWVVGRRADAPDSRPSTSRWTRDQRRRAVGHAGRRARLGPDRGGHGGVRRRTAVDGALLPRPRARARQRRGALRRHRPGRRLRPPSGPGRRHRAGDRADRVGRGPQRLPIRERVRRHRRRLRRTSPTTPTTPMATEPHPGRPPPSGRAAATAMWAAMEAHDLDVLVLGRVANIRYASGVPILWNAGTRPFGPGCVVVRATREIYLLSTWDEGVPDDIPHDHLYGITWNPMNFVKVLQGIATRRSRPRRHRRDVAAVRPAAPHGLPRRGHRRRQARAASQARRIKTDEEVDAIRRVDRGGRDRRWPRRWPSCDRA